MAEDFTRRFTGRAPFYSTSRPSYPMRILDILRTEIGFDRTFVVVDVGSGTGLLSELFLANGNHVIGMPSYRIVLIGTASLGCDGRGFYKAIHGSSPILFDLETELSNADPW